MEPRQYKLLAEILLVVGIALAALGLAVHYLTDIETIGPVLLILGCASALLALPTFMVLTLLTVSKK
jgi:hypothetical protein